jgi:prolyl oligopeptidase
VDDVVETLHGVAVRDPYRWMEHRGPDFDAHIDAQAAHARRILAAIPQRDRLRDAIHAANHGVTRVEVVRVTGPLATPRVFLMKRAPEDETPQLYVRDGWTGTDRLIVDPRTRGTANVHYSVDYATPSPDGKHVAFGISASGSEDSVVEIHEVDTGKRLAETIDRAQYAAIRWRDNRSFFYWRRRAPAPGDTRADWFKNSAAYLHVLGDNPERAIPVMSPTMTELGLASDRFTQIESSPRSRWALGAASPGTTEGGPANVPEFGTIADPVDFKYMLASDPYHRIVDGTRYPAILITGGKHDIRVPIWKPAKLAARLQAASGSDKPILLRVEADAGHGHDSTRSQREEELADLYAFALWQSGVAIAR